MKSYTIRIVMREKELKVLKSALQSYAKNKDICKDLLSIITCQENEANKE